MHQQGQKIKVHIDSPNGEQVVTGRLSRWYDGQGSVEIIKYDDSRITVPESRILYVEEVRSNRS